MAESPYPTYKDPTIQEAEVNPEYTNQAALIDEQAGINAKTYDQQRQDTINSYQSALDNINIGLKQAGIQSRASYAGRNLYNASGDVSGIGQQVGAANVEPYLKSIGNLQTQHEGNLGKISTAEAQSALEIKSKKYDTLQNVLKNLQASAKTTYNANVDAYNSAIKAKDDEANAALEEAKLPGGAIDIAKIRADQMQKGRPYFKSMNEVNAYIKKNGKDSVMKIGNDYFGLSGKELLDLKNTKLTIEKKQKDIARKALTTTKKPAAPKDIDLVLEDARAFADSVQTTSGGSGDFTREQIIEALAQDYPKLTRKQVENLIYNLYPDSYGVNRVMTPA